MKNPIRKDFTINDAISELRKASGMMESVIIVAEYPEINYVLAYRGTKFQPWVAAWAYRKEDNCWGQGHYFNTIEDALAHIDRVRKGEW